MQKSDVYRTRNLFRDPLNSDCSDFEARMWPGGGSADAEAAALVAWGAAAKKPAEGSTLP